MQKSPQKWKGKKKKNRKKQRLLGFRGLVKLSAAASQEAKPLWGETWFSTSFNQQPNTSSQRSAAQCSTVQRSAAQRPTSCSRSELSSSHFVIFCHLSCEPASKTQGGKKKVWGERYVSDSWCLASDCEGSRTGETALKKNNHGLSHNGSLFIP